MGFPVSERCSFASGSVPKICGTEHLSGVARAKTVDNGEQVSGEDRVIPMAPWPAGAIAAITLPSSSAFYHRPFTETFQIQREGGWGGGGVCGKSKMEPERRRGVLLLPRALVSWSRL